MKKLLLLAIALVPFMTMNAQITINQSDLPTIGQNWTSLNDNSTSTGNVISAGGPGQTWNFSSGWNLADTSFINFIDPTPLMGFSSFPTSNLGVQENGAGFEINSFYQTSSSGWSALGFDETYSGLVHAQFSANNYYFIHTPLSYGTNNTTARRSVAVTIYDPSLMNPAEKVISNETVTYNCDAWGQLTTPSQTANVLRVKEQVTSRVDSTFIDSLMTGSNFIFDNVTDYGADTYSTYSFIKNAPNSFVMSIEADNATGQVTLGSYYDNTVTSTGINPVSLQTTVYPNPASSMANFKLEGISGSKLFLYDSSGKEVWSYNVSGINSLSLSTLQFTSGLYIYRVTDQKGSVLNTGKLLIQN